jgi:hypothetical protein
MRGARASWIHGPSGRRKRRLPFGTRVAVPVVALALLTILPPAGATAQSRDPAVDQYVESVPRSDGDDPGGSEPRSGGGDLPSGVAREVERAGGDDAAALAAVASSPALGAPKTHRRPAQGAETETDSSALEASIGAATHDDGGSLAWLIAGVIAVTAAIGGTAWRARARH